MSTNKSIPSNGRWIALTVSILDRVFPRPRGFNVRLWDSEELVEGSSAPFTLVLNQPGALRRMFSPPIELSLGEAFINKDFDIEGDIISAFTCMESIASKLFSPVEMVALLRDLLALPRGNASQLAGRGPVKLSGAQHSLQRDRAAIQYHYDVGNEFYSLWLDSNMQYSCAYFQTGSESLDLAQEQKNGAHLSQATAETRREIVGYWLWLGRSGEICSPQVRCLGPGRDPEPATGAIR